MGLDAVTEETINTPRAIPFAITQTGAALHQSTIVNVMLAGTTR
jgi:hypothetical protein